MSVKRSQDLTIPNLRMVLNSVSSFLESSLRVLHQGGSYHQKPEEARDVSFSLLSEGVDSSQYPGFSLWPPNYERMCLVI